MVGYAFLSIERTWSYNFIGVIKEQRDLDMKVISAVYTMACNYIQERHNFNRTSIASPLNNCQTEIWKCSSELDLSADYNLFYCEAAYRGIKAGLDTLNASLQSVDAITDEKGDVLGFVVSVYRH